MRLNIETQIIMQKISENLKFCMNLGGFFHEIFKNTEKLIQDSNEKLLYRPDTIGH